MSNPFYIGMQNYIALLNELWNKVGTQGPQGDPGTVVTLSGDGDPNAQSPDIGDVGNYYIDETNSLYYQKQLVGSPSVATWVMVATIPGTGGTGVPLARYDFMFGLSSGGIPPASASPPILSATDLSGAVSLDWNTYRDYIVYLDDAVTSVAFSVDPTDDFGGDQFSNMHSPTGVPLSLRFIMGTGSPSSGKIADTAFDGISSLDFRNLQRELLRRFDFDLSVDAGSVLTLRLLYFPYNNSGPQPNKVNSAGNLTSGSGAFVYKIISWHLEASLEESGSTPRYPDVQHGNLHIAGALANRGNYVFSSSHSNAPTNGGTSSIPNDIGFVALEPAGTIATHTIDLPDAPFDGQEITITSTQTITALTLTDPSGNTITNPPTTLAAGVPLKYKFVILASNGVVGPINEFKWYRC